jgi:hypothetical protein
VQWKARSPSSTELTGRAGRRASRRGTAWAVLMDDDQKYRPWALQLLEEAIRADSAEERVALSFDTYTIRKDGVAIPGSATSLSGLLVGAGARVFALRLDALEGIEGYFSCLRTIEPRVLYQVREETARSRGVIATACTRARVRQAASSRHPHTCSVARSCLLVHTPARAPARAYTHHSLSPTHVHAKSRAKSRASVPSAMYPLSGRHLVLDVPARCQGQGPLSHRRQSIRHGSKGGLPLCPW